ncbi:hypothetical protein QTO34_000166, partial [Cnephaeus nilssonii]
MPTALVHDSRLTADDTDQLRGSLSSCLQELLLVIRTMRHILPPFVLVSPNRREFSALLLEVDSTYSGLLMYNNVRWLSRGKVLERFVECFEEIK